MGMRVLAILWACGLAIGCGRGQVDPNDELGTEPDTGDERSEVVVLAPGPHDSLGADSTGGDPAGQISAVRVPPRRSGSRALSLPPADEASREADELAIEVRPAAPPPALAVPAPASAPPSPEEDPGPSEPVVFDPRGEFTVQIGVFAEALAARRLVAELTDDGYPAYSLPAGDHKGVRVRIGYFRSHAEATRFGEIFRRDRGMSFWVDRRRNER
ncbi:MAG: SPOR domain-containing protein [Candidatus Latescibacterota bacterium]